METRIGDQNHSSTSDDANLLVLDILNVDKHPQYNGVAAYYDVAVIETETVTFSYAIQPICLPRLLFV